MIKFFKKIRFQLLSRHKISNYLLYAIGEILLVVVGILIALQVSNWKEEQENQSRQEAFYHSIRIDLENDQKNMEALNVFYNNRIRNLTWLLTRVRNPDQQPEPTDFGKHTEPLYYSQSAISFNATFETSKSTGTFEHFTDRKLLKRLIEYYSDFEGIEDVQTSTLRYIETVFEPLMAPLPNDFINTETGDEVVIVEGNTDFYSLLGSIEDRRGGNTKKAIGQLLQDPSFESFLIGDLGRSFNMLNQLRDRGKKRDELEHAISEYLKE